LSIIGRKDTKKVYINRNEKERILPLWAKFCNFAAAMKKYIASAVVLILALASCDSEGGKFHIKGQITAAQDTMLYLEHLTLEKGPVAIDSALLDKEGAFDLKGDTTGNPEFYRLRIGNQVINLSVDSTETITVTANLPTMAGNYKVEGSGNCDTIRILSQKLGRLNSDIRRIADDRSLTLADRQSAIEERVKEYKTDIKLNFIQNRYDRASSYFAMFQMSEGQMVFDPVSDASDVTWFTAIANAWLANWPGKPRTENLCNIALRGHRNTRKRTIEVNLDDDKVTETGIIDMGFPDINGKERRLSHLKGSVVILDFTAYSIKGSQERIMAMRELYNKYHSQGLEIYQVSLDSDEHYWKTMSQQLPWVCVWDSEGLNNDIVGIYNLRQVPTWFLIDRGNNLVGRQELMGNLEEEIRKLL